MPGPFSSSGARSGREEPSIGSAARARGYARHYLWNAFLFWGAASLGCASGLTFLIFARPLGEETAFRLAASLLGVSLAYAGRRAALALRDLTGEPTGFEGRVASKASSVFWNKLAFLEEKYYLRIVRGAGMRPLASGGGKIIEEGWFLAARDYHDLLAPDDQVRGTIYRGTRLIAALVKV